MKMNVNGVVISSVSAGQLQSNEGEDYMVMWDKDSVPIHIKKDIVDYLYAVLHHPQKKVNNDSPFLEGMV